MNILVLNCGSSSVKFQLIETSLEAIEKGTEQTLARGAVEKIGAPAGIIRYDAEGKEPLMETAEILEHRVAIDKILRLLTHPELGVVAEVKDIGAVGHRIVHGGEKFSASVIITPEVLKQLRDCIELAPLHNPHNIRGYQIASELLPEVPHVGVFDTAFHQTMPQIAYMYGLPYVLYKRYGIRRYGFHGTSHLYLVFRLERLTGIPRGKLRIITCHLGQGCSMAAVKHGKSVDTTMGFTPLEGLVMGTRSGDLDPAIVPYLIGKEELELHEVQTLLNKHSGILGVSGVSNDMRELLEEMEHGNERAKLAIDIFCYRIRKYIGAYAAAMGGVDYIAFTAGIGEHAVYVREKACEDLGFLGVEIDPEKNQKMVGKEGCISADTSLVKVYVILTQEELVIARETVRAIKGVRV